MKKFSKQFRFFPEKPLHILQRKTSRRNAQLLINLLSIFGLLIILYSALFHVMAYLENLSFSLLTGLYWTLTTMTTLGLGDIAFQTDLGRIYTVIVLLSGILFLLVIIPFTFIQLFQSTDRVPRELPHNIKNHVVLTSYDAVTIALVKKLIGYQIPYVMIIADLTEALSIIDRGYRIVSGNLDDPETYNNVNAPQAALIALTNSDAVNTSITYAIRSITENTPIVSITRSSVASDILRIAGCNHVMALDEILGKSLARRVISGDAMSHVIGQVDDIYIAEATATGTPIIGKTLSEIKLPDIVGATVVGVWDRGDFRAASADTLITNQTAMVIAGSKEQIDMYNEMFCIYNSDSNPVLIIGGGNVGITMGYELAERDVNYRIIEKSLIRIPKDTHYIHGNAMNTDILLEAGIMETPAVAITSHDDSVNLYLTTLCRHINPKVQILTRASEERSIPLLHKAGSDFVMSYASIGANSIFNYMQSGNILMVTEGVDVFKVKLPKVLAGKKIAETTLRKDFGCSLIGIKFSDHIEINPSPQTELVEESDIILIGTVESEIKFLSAFDIS